MSNISPTQPTNSDMIIVNDECLFNPSHKKDTYGPWTCKKVSFSDFDRESVQIKQELGKILFLRPYHQYQIDEKQFKDCPLDSVVKVKTNVSITIRRHSSRREGGILARLTQQSVQLNGKARFPLPESFFHAAPEIMTDLQFQINETQAKVKRD